MGARAGKEEQQPMEIQPPGDAATAAPAKATGKDPATAPLLKKPKPKKVQKGGIRKWLQQQAAKIALIQLIVQPWVVFTVLICLFAFSYHQAYQVVLIFALASFMISVVLIMSDMFTKEGGQWYLFMGVLCLIATVSASLLGMYIYLQYMYPYWKMEGLREYKNVLPSEPAGSKADAGKIIFSQDAKVDMTRSVGFKAGQTYCVAPILDDTQVTRVNFWAAGTNCCKPRGEFNCDSVWDTSARSGAVVLESGNWARVAFSPKDFYRRAVKEAESLYDLASDEDPIFVHWVNDVAGYQSNFWHMGLALVLNWIFIYSIASLPLGFVMNWAFKMRLKQQKIDEHNAV